MSQSQFLAATWHKGDSSEIMMSKTALLTGKLLIRLGQPEDSMRVVSRRPLGMLKQGELDFV
jgi:hypothetical protein